MQVSLERQSARAVARGGIVREKLDQEAKELFTRVGYPLAKPKK